MYKYLDGSVELGYSFRQQISAIMIIRGDNYEKL